MPIEAHCGASLDELLWLRLVVKSLKVSSVYLCADANEEFPVGFLREFCTKY